MRKIAGVLALTVSASACGSVASGFVNRSDGYGRGHKIVSAKEAPNILFATDGASCEVARKNWEKVKVGDNYYCLWSQTIGDNMPPR